jgi:hypothetical protein
MASAAPAQPPNRRHRRPVGGILLPAVAAGSLLLTVSLALLVASQLGPSEPTLERGAERGGRSAVVASSAVRRTPPAGAVDTNARPTLGQVSSASGTNGRPNAGARASASTGSPGQPTADAAGDAVVASLEAAFGGMAGGEAVDGGLARELAGALASASGSAGIPPGDSTSATNSTSAGAAAAASGAAASGGSRFSATVSDTAGIATSSPAAGPASADAQSAALAALTEAMRASVPQTLGVGPPYPSGGLGLPEGDWAGRGRRDVSGVRGWYSLRYRDGNIARIEKTMSSDSALTLENARLEAAAQAPDDATVISRGAAGPETVDVLGSKSLANRFPDVGVKAGEPAPFHVRYRRTGDRVTGYALQLGAP